MKWRTWAQPRLRAAATGLEVSEAHTACPAGQSATPARLVRAVCIRIAQRGRPWQRSSPVWDETPQVAWSEPQAEIERGRATSAGQPYLPTAVAPNVNIEFRSQ